MSDHHPAGRALVVAGALAALVLAGCGTPSTTPPDGGTSSRSPGGTAAETTPADTGSTPSPTAPARSVTADNLLTVDDIYSDDPLTTTVVETEEGQGRSTAQSYVCLPDDGLTSLGGTAMVTRNFAYKIVDAKSDPHPKSPLKNKPVIFTQAIQFPDAAAATAARAKYASWIENCAKTLTEKGYTIDGGQSTKLSKLRVEGAKAEAGMVAYVQPGGSDAENLFWESAAVTQVKDRLMLTVSLTWGMDNPGSFDSTDGDFVNPVVVMSELSAEALAR